jgi:hypothetical protein
VALTFEFEFSYAGDPEITIRITSPDTGSTRLARAYIDTGAQRTIIDTLFAELIGLDLAQGEEISLTGLGGTLEARVLEVELSLLGEPELSFRLPVAFAPMVSSRLGNLISLDVLSQFSLGLDHGRKLGYLGLSDA